MPSLIVPFWQTVVADGMVPRCFQWNDNRSLGRRNSASESQWDCSQQPWVARNQPSRCASARRASYPGEAAIASATLKCVGSVSLRASLKIRFGVPPLGGTTREPPKSGTPNLGHASWVHFLDTL